MCNKFSRKSEISDIQWIYDAHTLLNCLIIRLILKIDAALSAKTICNSSIYKKTPPVHCCTGGVLKKMRWKLSCCLGGKQASWPAFPRAWRRGRYRPGRRGSCWWWCPTSKAPRLRSCESPNNAPRRKQKQKINASGDRSNACLRYFYAPTGKEEQYGLFLRA